MATSPQILIQRGLRRYGPFSPVEILTHHRDRRFQASDLAWTDGLPAWEPLGDVMGRLGHVLPAVSEHDDGLRWIMPVGRSLWAIAAGYLGLIGIFTLLPAPFAVVCGVLGLRSIKRQPELAGKGRAWFGIIAGMLGTLGLLGIFAALIIESS